ncbi:Transcription factor steA [Portunus trituberculatus]|uniref:Transcription factor steA n=1 Tax=Portunus trituberculatus TaxID=210409 RepID=A0A5B7EYS4_PORTR|nr:Transcription factor steA [Portunus trituberculatus]
MAHDQSRGNGGSMQPGNATAPELSVDPLDIAGDPTEFNKYLVRVNAVLLVLGGDVCGKRHEWAGRGCVEGESSVGSTSFTDMTSTMRVTREATNALYPEQSMHHLVPSNSDQAQYLSRSAVNSGEGQGGQGGSPSAFMSIINTPSPSSNNSDSSHCAYTSPLYSPQHPQNFYGVYSHGQNPQHNQVATSPTYNSLHDHSPSTFGPPGQVTPLNNHISPQMTPAYNQVLYQTASTYSYQQDLVTPTCTHPPDDTPSISGTRSSHISPDVTPLPAPVATSPYHEDSKVRNGKMYYTTYLNNHGAAVPKLERPARHPSGPTPTQAGQGRGQLAMQFPETKLYPLPPNVSLSRFFHGFENSFPYHVSPQQGSPASQGFGSVAYLNNHGSAPGMSSSPQVSAQFPASYPAAGVAPHPHTCGGARHKTCNKNNNSKREPNRESPKGSPCGSVKEKERIARRAARKLSRGVLKRKRGCTCYSCQIVFASSGHLKRHMEAHGSNRRFKCPHPYCDVAYSRQDNLKAHVAKAIHRREGDPYTIPVSDDEDSDDEDCSFGGDYNIVGINDFLNYEPHDDDDVM